MDSSLCPMSPTSRCHGQLQYDIDATIRATHSPGLLLLTDLSKLLKPGGHNPVSLTHCHFLGVPSSLSTLPHIYLHWLGFI